MRSTASLRRLLFALLSLSAGLLDANRAAAQPYPSRPVTMVLPFAAGGSSDTIARIVAEGMRASLGQPVIIENVPGASGSLGTERAARAPADGYTICLGSWASHVVNGAVNTLQYDVLNDFEPISLIVSNPLVIVVRKTIPANDLGELIAWFKANPANATLGTAGPGSAAHLAGLFFSKQTGTRLQHVPYRGLGFAMQDLVGGRIDMIFDLAANSLPQVRAGTVKALAVTAKSRLEVAPDIPTVDEAGLPGLYMSVWQAVWAPKGTPPAIIERLNAAVVDSLALPTTRRRLADLGQEIFPRAQQTPEGLHALQRSEIEKWWPIIKAENIKAQ
jgi:tripartite-type tricarboxylate transporter receptor subunit TctC